jgi:hypothetical protein
MDRQRISSGFFPDQRWSFEKVRREKRPKEQVG